VILVSHDRELLRVLTSKLWVLHDRHVTEFGGGFAEWEAVSAERERAAEIRASEEAALRRVHEKQRLDRVKRDETAEQSKSARDLARGLRRAQRTLEEIEQRIESLESQVGALSAALEDPQLYTTTGGPSEAARLGAELERAKAELDNALEQWGAASEEVVTLERDLAAAET